VAFDDRRHRVYVAGGEGFIAVYQQDAPNSYRLLAKVPSAAGAKTCLLVPELDRLYVAVSPGDSGAKAKVLTYQIE
jgi:hypothetical protein